MAPRRLIAAGFAGLLAIATAAPTFAATPERSHDVYDNTFVLAECDGYDVVESNVRVVESITFLDAQGNVQRSMGFSAATGTVYREYPDGSTVQVATYTDKGGYFSQIGDDLFRSTGVLDWFRLRDGSWRKRVGYFEFRVTSWDPFELEVLHDVGVFMPDDDPCTW